MVVLFNAWSMLLERLDLRNRESVGDDFSRTSVCNRLSGPSPVLSCVSYCSRSAMVSCAPPICCSLKKTCGVVRQLDNCIMSFLLRGCVVREISL